MPKIKITEKDYTGNIIGTELNNTVYFPFAGKSDTAKAPTLCETVDDLDSYLDTESKGVTKLPYRVARYLIQKGFTILAEIISSTEIVPSTSWDRLQDRTLYDIRFLTTGCLNYSDANAIKCAAKRGDCVALCDYRDNLKPEYVLTLTRPEDWSTHYENYYTRTGSYQDISTYTVKPSFVSGKYYLRTTKSETEYQFFKLLEEPEDWNQYPSGKYFEFLYTYSALTSFQQWEEDKYYAKVGSVASYDVKAIRQYYKNLIDTVGSGNEEMLKYASAFVPSIKTKNSNLLYNLKDSDGKLITEATIPASIGYLLGYMNSFSNGNPEWYAVAGSFRGNIPELSGVLYEFSNAECEILQARAVDKECELDEKNKDNYGFAINPIAYVRPFGYILWGNRTLLINAGSLKASSFLNVRNLVSSINKSLYETSRKYTFEQNSDILWTNFQTQVALTLDKMQSGNGILGYRFIREATDKKARLKARLRIIPIEAVEDFELGIELADSLEIVE